MAIPRKRVTNGYSLRFPEDYRARLETVAKKKSLQTGKNVPLSQILMEAVEYGLPLVEQEMAHQNVMPLRARTKTQHLIEFAKSIVAAAAEHGIDQQPGEAA
jgi:predicted DNA-binding protein